MNIDPDPSLQAAPDSTFPTLEPDTFCARALAAGEAGMQAAEVALGRSPSADVRAFAMIAMVEHGRTTTTLQSLACRRSRPMLNEPQPTSSLVEELRQLDETCFDAAFARSQIAANEAAIDLLARSATDIEDFELQDFAQSALPVFVNQLQQARALAAAHPVR